MYIHKNYLRSRGFGIETENKAGEAKEYGQNHYENTGFAAEIGGFRIWNKILMGHSSYSCSRHACSCQCLIDKNRSFMF